ncbi:acetylornithine deacetylase/succinyl-diaminopimelate desuccinylase-like protein [Pseudarthrobacter sp. PvP022]
MSRGSGGGEPGEPAGGSEVFPVVTDTGRVLAMTSSPAGTPQKISAGIDGIGVEALRRAVHESFDTTVGQLKDLVKLPGVAWPSFDPAPLDRSAEAVAELVRAAGIADVRILRCNKEDGTPGGPAVVARRTAAEGKPTILLYAHHDVQPTGDLALWETEPFTAVERDGRLYGRGAADDKAGIMAHIAAYAAVTEVLADELGLGVTFFFEGEEEAGSPTFRTFLETHRELLRADVIVVADSSNWKVGIPALTTSLRGLVDGTIEVQVLEHAVHSGMFGGAVLDAPTLLSRLIATLHDDEGNVAVKGLVSRDDVSVDLTEAEYRADASVLDGVRLAGSGTIASRLWTKPALSIIGFDAPAVDVASNTLLPRARAKFSLRLAPGQDPADAMAAVRNHVESNAPFGAKVVFTPGESGSSFLTDTGSAAAGMAMWALGEAWGVPAVEMGIGGSIPFIADLTEVYPDVQILVTGVEDPDSRAHSANESLHLEDFRNAVVAEALLIARLNHEGLA